MMVARQNTLPKFGLLILRSLLWGASFTLVEVAIMTVPPTTVVFGRLVVGASLLLLLTLWLREPLPNSLLRWGALSLQGILQSALPFTLITWGQTHIDSGLAGILNTTPPIFVLLIGFLLLRDRTVGFSKVIGILLGFAGVLAILGPAALSGETSSVLGQLAITGASISYAVAALYAQRFSDQSPIVTAACSMTFAAVVMCPASLIIDSPLTLVFRRLLRLPVSECFQLPSP